MGQIESALACFQKSALLIERNPAREHFINQAYIRTWIGELLAGREEFKLAYVFLHAAGVRWRQAAPPKAKATSHLMAQLETRLGYTMKIKDDEADRICLSWVLGQTVDLGSSRLQRLASGSCPPGEKETALTSPVPVSAMVCTRLPGSLSLMVTAPQLPARCRR